MRKIKKYIKESFKLCLTFLRNLILIVTRILPFLKNPAFFPPSIIFAVFKRSKGISSSEASFLYHFTKMIKPEMVLETGTCFGFSTSFIAFALAKNGTGHCHTFEIEQNCCEGAKENFNNLGLTKWITVHLGDSRKNILKLIKENIISHNLDFVYLDSGTPATIEEFEILKSHIKSGSGYLICHDVFQPNLSGKGVILYPYIRDKYSKSWDVCVLHTGGPGLLVARKRSTDGCDAYKSLDSYNIKDWKDYLTNWLPKITG